MPWVKIVLGKSSKVPSNRRSARNLSRITIIHKISHHRPWHIQYLMQFTIFICFKKVTFIVIFIFSFHGINFFNNSYWVRSFHFFVWHGCRKNTISSIYISGYTRLIFFIHFTMHSQPCFLPFLLKLFLLITVFVCLWFYYFSKNFLLLLLLIGLFFPLWHFSNGIDCSSETFSFWMTHLNVGWKFTQWKPSPCEGEYRERVAYPLNNFLIFHLSLQRRVCKH